MSEECHEMTRRRRGTSPASLPDDDNLLWEILIRLSSQPSSLPRASAVCRRWRRLVTDPRFLRRFRAHHRKPPILGFLEGLHEFFFMSILDPPDRIPPERFSLRRDRPLGCRHGRVLVQDWERNEVIVCDPITGERIRVAAPPEFKYYSLNGAVLCAADEQGHVHGSCHSSPFKVVVLVSMHREDLGLVACVYSSKTGASVVHNTYKSDMTIPRWRALKEEATAERRAEFHGGWLDAGGLAVWVEDIKDELQEQLKRLEIEEVVSDKVVNDLKRRKLTTKEKSIWYSLKKGPEFVAKRKTLATDVTREHLKSGDWKDLEFKDYNYGAQGQPIPIGYVQPLLEVREAIQNIFLQMG